jgi:hypothetical protein
VSRRRALALVLLSALSLSPSAALAADAVRVQAEGAAALPPFIPGAPPAKPPDAATLRALRQTAVADGIEQAVLAYAAQLARPELRDDEDALRAALGGGRLAAFALGHGVLGEIGAREAKPKRKPGDPPPKPRKPSAPVPMEYAWRVEALVDATRVRAALDAAGAALVSGADSGARTEVVLEAPYDAAMVAALRARLVALGARSVVPRRYEATAITLSVRGVPPGVVRERLAAEPPAGYASEVLPQEDPLLPVRVRMRAEPPAPVPPRAK